jgi:hypothetical protein
MSSIAGSPHPPKSLPQQLAVTDSFYDGDDVLAFEAPYFPSVYVVEGIDIAQFNSGGQVTMVADMGSDVSVFWALSQTVGESEAVSYQWRGCIQIPPGTQVRVSVFSEAVATAWTGVISGSLVYDGPWSLFP